MSPEKWTPVFREGICAKKGRRGVFQLSAASASACGSVVGNQRGGQTTCPPRLLLWRISFLGNRRPLFRDMRYAGILILAGGRFGILMSTASVDTSSPRS